MMQRTVLGATHLVHLLLTPSLLLLLCRCTAGVPADVFEFVLVFVVVHLLSPERAAALPPEIR
jgi:hypothetical protein